MANPREVFSHNRIGSLDVTYQSDSSIVPPVPGPNGYTPNQSAQIGLACTNVATGTNDVQVGLGTAGKLLWGKIMQVEPDGAVTVQRRGYMYLPYVTGANQPVPGQFVTVDGTGKVQLSATNTPTNAVCEGFAIDPMPLATPGVPGVLACKVYLS